MVESHSREPLIVEPPVGSLTNKPPLVAPVPFNSKMLSPNEIAVELIDVCVPLTVKSPKTTIFEPVNSKAVLREEVYDKIDAVTFDNVSHFVSIEPVYVARVEFLVSCEDV